MPKIMSAVLKGASGTEYPVNVYTKGTEFNDMVLGVYIIGQDREDGPAFIFVGESKEGKEALSQIYRHARAAEWDKHGWNAIGFYRIADPAKRKAACEDIAAALKPALA